MWAIHIPWPSVGRNAWTTLTDDCKAFGAVKREDASGLGALMWELHLPGDLCEEVR